MTRPLSVLLALVVLGGCTHRPLVRDAPVTGPVLGFPDHTPDQIVAAVAASAGRVQTAAVDGRIAFVQDGRSQDATFSLRARFLGEPGDSVTVIVRGPLGIEGGRGLVTADSMFVADRIHRRLYLGPVAAVDRFVPGGGSPEQLVRAALGLLVPDAGAPWTVTTAGSRYVLRAPLSADESREVTVDPALWRVVGVRDLGPDGTVIGTQEATDFDQVDGVVVPRRVRAAGGGVEVTMENRSIDLAPDPLRLRFRRPDDYETVPLE